MSTIQTVVGILIFAAGLSARFAFDQAGRQLGWSREDRREQGQKIEAVDKAARDSIARVERELGDKVSALAGQVGVLDERVKHLPTADDIEEVSRRLSGLEREVTSATTKIEGMSFNVKTVLDHILAGEKAR